MDYLPKTFLQFNSTTLEEVRQDVNLHRPGEMKEAVRILEEWIQQQPHFKKKDFSVLYLESSIVSSKGSLERAKKITDRMCTMRTLMPRYFEPYDVREGYQQHLKGKINILTLPGLIKDNYRIHIVKVIQKTLTGEPLVTCCKHIYTGFDFLKIADYNSGIILIFDLVDANLPDVLKNFNFLDFNTIINVLLECYGLRVKRIHMVTSSAVISVLLSFCKRILNKKIFDRIIVHKTPEELHQYYPGDVLPKDYGGTERTIEELQELCLDAVSSDVFSDYFKSLRDATVDESLRPQGQFSEMYAGVTGTFRTLNVD